MVATADAGAAGADERPTSPSPLPTGSSTPFFFWRAGAVVEKEEGGKEKKEEAGAEAGPEAEREEDDRSQERGARAASRYQPSPAMVLRRIFCRVAASASVSMRIGASRSRGARGNGITWTSGKPFSKQ